MFILKIFSGFTDSKINVKFNLMVLFFFGQTIISYTDKVFSLLPDYLPKNPIILEAGAHTGSDTLRLLKVFPEALIYCFEPIPHNYAKLQENVKDKINVKTFNLALCNINGPSQMYVNETNFAACSLNKPIINSAQYNSNSIYVECITCDKWIVVNGVDHVDFMWLDMEGFELQFLRTVPEKILNTVRAIYVEVNFQKFWAETHLYGEVQNWMNKQGFKKIFLDGAISYQANVLFIRDVY